MPRSRAALVVLALAALPGLLPAQGLPIDPPLAVPGVRYDTTVPTPERVLGHRVGTRHTRPDELVSYYRALDEVSDRVVLGTHGRTYEGRPLVHAIVTSPANHRRLGELRLRNLRLSDEPANVTDAELDAMPVVLYLGYSVHGNEASGSEAALLTLYHLAAGTGGGLEGLLEQAIIILDPSLNPDGRARFVDWVNGQRGAVPTSDPQDREHGEPWPGGRTNHYWFDLNRDWLPAQHPESEGRLTLFHTWRPQFLADLHEMGADQTFFFQPGVPSRVNPNTPERVNQLTAELATHHAAWLDRIGSLYYTRQAFDDFYYGKGSTYPDVNGAVGILFEQASSRALRRATAFGELTYGFTVRNQASAALSSIAGVVAMKAKFLAHQRDFYREASGGPKGGTTAWVVSLQPDRTRAQAMLRALVRHRIRVHELARPVTAQGRTYAPGAAVIIPAAQPQRRLIQATMERLTQFRDSVFYDISAWSFPLAFGVPSAEITGEAAPLLGGELRVGGFDGGTVSGTGSYAYVLEWNRYFAPRALHRLHDAGVVPLLATEPFEARVAGQPRRFARGSIVVPVVPRSGTGPGAEALARLMRDLAEQDHVQVAGVDGGLSLSGPDLGAESSAPLRRPVVALVAGEGQPAGEVGEAWHLLAERFRMPVSLLDAARLAALDLSRYTAIILAGALPGGRDGAVRQRLEQWVRAGGTLITLKAGTRWAVETGLTDEKLRALAADSGRRSFEAQAQWQAAQELSGAILEAQVDTTHPLAYGYEGRLPVFKSDTLALEPSKVPGATVLRHGSEPRLAGYIPARALPALRGSAALLARRSGRGQLVLFADNPNFRAFWYGTNGLFLNAVMFGGVW